MPHCLSWPLIEMHACGQWVHACAGEHHVVVARLVVEHGGVSVIHCHEATGMLTHTLYKWIHVSVSKWAHRLLLIIIRHPVVIILLLHSSIELTLRHGRAEHHVVHMLLQLRWHVSMDNAGCTLAPVVDGIPGTWLNWSSFCFCLDKA